MRQEETFLYGRDWRAPMVFLKWLKRSNIHKKLCGRTANVPHMIWAYYSQVPADRAGGDLPAWQRLAGTYGISEVVRTPT
jgi:hypothetical protein